MSAKLIVHKIENGDICKSLLITITEGHINDTSFSEWLEGEIIKKGKESENSSRLVVKIVTGNNCSNFDLDNCARLVDNFDTSASHGSLLNNDSQLCFNNEPADNICLNSYEQFRISTDSRSSENCSTYSTDGVSFCPNNNVNGNMQLSNLCPLEYSLEKVKENNAQIMKNIHMLNRTLNYTEKKEILNVICPKTMPSYPCETCGKSFVYETGLKRHYAMRHAITETNPRWQVVWTCIQCFQVWPKQDLALIHSKQCSKIDNNNCAREIKTSSLLQCEFCEKVFTSIPRLLRHENMHLTKNNYECNMCEISFISFRAAEGHWMLCPWLKEQYNFSLPKLLLCNACDRKFRNYEQLYNHRYKTGHFMAKNNSELMGSLVYQCELCATCFKCIPPLQAHKSQCHPYQEMVTCNVTTNYNDFQRNYFTTDIELRDPNGEQ